MDNILTLNNQQLNQNELVTTQEQNNFLNTTVGKVVNTAIDLGLRWVLPNFIEDQVIDIKNSLIKGGLKEGINTTVQKGIEIGKSVTGIFTGKFENISQAQNAIKNGGIIDGISDVIDSTLNFTSKKGMIPSNVTTLIRKGKNVILNNISSNIETEIAPIVGTEQQAKDLITYNGESDARGESIWETNIFGKSIEQLV